MGGGNWGGMAEAESTGGGAGGVDTSPAAPVYPLPSRPLEKPPTRATGPLIDIGPGWERSGAVTQLGTTPQAAPEEAPERPRSSRRTLLWFAGGAGVILAVGIVILLAMAMTGNG